ncbi:hypothetical protein MNBD_GAMMA22-2861 [hydrothermal vent metagenome]|uniref:Uncharacterized protein n=1 Tax=hydrothermal vent metagenome TaxID=652676 RepID=A0A3B1A1K3_9ZZZZ
MILRYTSIKKALVIPAILVFGLCFTLITSKSYAKQDSSIDIAVKELRSKTKGKIISADTVLVDNVQKHRIKVLLPNGIVKVFFKAIK